MIGIIGAMEVEIELLRDDLQLERTLTKAGMEFYAGQLADKQVVLVQCGIGKVNAGVCTQILVDEFAVDQIVFTGVAGAIDAELDMEDIVVSTELVQHDVDVTAFGDYNPGEIPGLGQTFPADQQLIQLAEAAGEQVAEKENLRVVTGRILSGDQFISAEEKVADLKEKFSGYCTEMEGAAVGQVAQLNEVPFVVIRSISDKADAEADISFTEFVKEAADHSYQIVKEIVVNID